MCIAQAYVNTHTDTKTYLQLKGGSSGFPSAAVLQIVLQNNVLNNICLIFFRARLGARSYGSTAGWLLTCQEVKVGREKYHDSGRQVLRKLSSVSIKLFLYSSLKGWKNTAAL